jgi:hypothetical protein
MELTTAGVKITAGVVEAGSHILSVLYNIDSGGPILWIRISFNFNADPDTDPDPGF